MTGLVGTGPGWAWDGTVRAYVIFRDRVSYAQACVAALIAAGLDVTIVDHGTTFPAARDWLADCARAGIPVWYHGGGSPRDLWGVPQFREAVAGQPYVATDPDVVPDENCPLDWPQHLLELADAYLFPKVGLGLRIDDIPMHYPRREQVLNWERQYWERQHMDGVYDAAIDTTMAVYRAGNVALNLDGARTGPPYVARHLAWYEDPDALPDDIAWYYAHVEPGITFWSIGGPSAWGN